MTVAAMQAAFTLGQQFAHQQHDNRHLRRGCSSESGMLMRPTIVKCRAGRSQATQDWIALRKRILRDSAHTCTAPAELTATYTQYALPPQLSKHKAA